ncbi:MAG: MFS transporter, partial [Acidimicrobiia bacterium]
GVAAAGLLVTQPGGFSIVFAANSYTFIVSALFLWRLRPIRAQAKQESFGGRSGIWTGVRYLRRNTTLKLATIGGAVTNLVFAPLEALLLKFVDEQLLATSPLPWIFDSLFQGPARVGFFVAVQAVVGSIGIVLAPRLADRIRLGRMYVIGMLALGVGFAAVSAMESFWAVLPAGLALAGVGWVNVAFFTLRQRLTPEEALGRVIAASRTLSWLLIPVGAALGGWLADEIGLLPVYLFGSLAVIGVGTVLLATPLYRADGTPDPSPWDRAMMHGSPTRGRK